MASNSDIRIARNTVIIYIRMAVTILVGLVTSRLVLQALGASDVGIYSAVGSTVALVGVITGALSGTTVRFMNIETGKAGGNPNRMFNICHTIHLGGAAASASPTSPSRACSPSMSGSGRWPWSTFSTPCSSWGWYACCTSSGGVPTGCASTP